MAEVGCRADLANWAAAAGWRLRASGYSHNWSPLAIDPVRSDPARVLLVDLRAGMSSVQVDAASRQVSAGAGASLDAIHEALKANRLALAHSPAVGAITIGGALAIGAHGSAVRAAGESARSGWVFGWHRNADPLLEQHVIQHGQPVRGPRRLDLGPNGQPTPRPLRADRDPAIPVH